MPPINANVASATPSDSAGDFSAFAFMFRQLMAGVRTVGMVRVKAVTNSGGVAAAGKVDVQPLVHQLDGNGNIVPHGTVYELPYFRLLGGADAVILDPKVGDIGLAVFADRDSSAVIATGAAAAPGSNRRFDFADGFYIGGVLNGVPEQYVRFSADGIEVVSPSKITIHSPNNQIEGPLHVTGPVTADSSITAAGEVTGKGIALSTHVHGGVQSGGSTTSPPQ